MIRAAVVFALAGLSLQLVSATSAYSFVSIGDWGGATLGGYHQSNAVAVAKQLGASASELNAHFVINTGDNFYYCGVKNIDDEQFKQDFEDVFTDKSLYVPWYGVLGNHDYAFDVESQLKYKSPNNDRWHMPSRYYSKRILLEGNQYATLIFLDTNPCVQAYRSTDPKGWDPCSGEFGNECFEGDKCYFHDHVVSQDCDKQYEWLSSTLASIPADDWKIAVGHHPAGEIDVKDVTGLLLHHNVNLYLNGHTHALRHYQVDDDKSMDLVTTGAGCMVHEHALDEQSPNSSQQELFYKRASGFTVHTFAEDFSTLTTKFLDTKGSVMHSFVTAKSGAAPPAPPSPPSPSPPAPKPTPPPPSPSAGSCKQYGCRRYDRHHQCQCNERCKKHKDCCTDYDQVCGKNMEIAI